MELQGQQACNDDEAYHLGIRPGGEQGRGRGYQMATSACWVRLIGHKPMGQAVAASPYSRPTAHLTTHQGCLRRESRQDTFNRRFYKLQGNLICVLQD